MLIDQPQMEVWRPVSSRELNHPATLLARYLLGYNLVHATDEGVTVGKIVETEAYLGAEDAAAHSYRGITERTRGMFGPGGHAYIYLSYGIHYCLNVTAGRVSIGQGVLIRALEPVAGVELMLRRRGQLSTLSDKVGNGAIIHPTPHRVRLTNGPGKLAQAMGISKHLYGHDLTQPPFYLSAGSVDDSQVMIGPRVGISQAKELPLRHWIKGNPFVSKSPHRSG